jgi:S-adenosylmethionine decarboxylase
VRCSRFDQNMVRPVASYSSRKVHASAHSAGRRVTGKAPRPQTPCTHEPLAVTCHRSVRRQNRNTLAVNWAARSNEVSKAIIMDLGTEWLVDAEGCSAELLRNIDAVRGVCEEVIADLALHVVGGAMWHQFPQPGGVTGLYLLTESHLACHTFPETGLATFNLYCCRPRPPFAWDQRLRTLLDANRVTVRTATRGAETNADPDFLESGGSNSFDSKVSQLPSAREVRSL